jgi:hypothetical protein
MSHTHRERAKLLSKLEETPDQLDAVERANPISKSRTSSKPPRERVS